jgi:hypothetical protein
MSNEGNWWEQDCGDLPENIQMIESEVTQTTNETKFPCTFKQGTMQFQLDSFEDYKKLMKIF